MGRFLQGEELAKCAKDQGQHLLTAGTSQEVVLIPTFSPCRELENCLFWPIYFVLTLIFMLSV